ncbi:hypothetical protein LCGC14_0676300 [marine sediment metagenome]|uniref:Uncharacterized protein n=2 Tax=root TaxID=1 RepID=A0A831QQW8_9FLAO|nr:hypothetical protein [Pricia antarctica]
MEGNKRKVWQKGVRSIRRLYHSLNNYRIKANNPDFREFSFLEYAEVRPEEVGDLERLRYIKKLDLAQKGYINTDLKKLLSHFGEKERLMRKDHTIIPIANLKVFENQTPLCLIQLGYEAVGKTFFMAGRNHENIPLWKSFNSLRLREYLSAVHPVMENALQLKHTFFEMDVSQCSKEDKDAICKFYNETVVFSFRTNPYFKASVLTPKEEILLDAKKFVGETFRLSISKNESSLMTLTEATERYFVFQSFLKSAPEPESIYFDRPEFKERFLDSGITLIAHLKHNLRLGVRNGILQIGKLDGSESKDMLRWESFENRIASSMFSAKEKYYLSNEVITKKNFLVEKDAVLLKSGIKTAQLKKHYGTGQWHFAESNNPSQELRFKPIDKKALKNIQDHYGHCKNFNKAIARIKKYTNQQTIQL